MEGLGCLIEFTVVCSLPNWSIKVPTANRRRSIGNPVHSRRCTQKILLLLYFYCIYAIQVLCTVYFYLLSQIFRQKHESILTVVAGREIQMERLRLSFRGVQFRLVHKITAPTGPIDVNTHSTRSETFSDVQHVYKCMYY